MSIPKVIGVTTYNVPTNGQRGWGTDVTNLLARLADVADQVVKAQYILTTDNFFKDVSGNFGLKANFLKGVGAIASADGFIRMASPHANPGQGLSYPTLTPEGKSYTYLSWRNSTNSGDLHLFPSSNNTTLTFAGKEQVNLDAIQILSNKYIDATNQVVGDALVDGAVTNAKVSAIAAIELSKLEPRATNSVAVFNASGYLEPANATTTELSYIQGVTSNIQTQINAKLTGNAPIVAGTATKITYDTNGFVTAGTSLLAADLPTGIDAAKVGAGLVSNTEFGYLDGVTSALQTQLNAKQGTGNYITDLNGDVVASGPGSAAATIAALAVTTGKIANLAVTDTKLNTDAVITSKIQALAVTDAKIAAGVDAVKIGAGTVSNTVFGYLAGTTSAIQTQLDAKIPSAILTTKGDLLTRNATVNARIAVGTNGQYLKADSTTATGLAWADLAGGGSGSGEKNYIGNPNSATNWVEINRTLMAVDTESVQANLPDNSTQLTGIKFTRASGSTYVYYRFTLDKADYNKKLKIQKDIAYAGATGDYRIEIYSNTASNYGGTSTQLTVGPTANLPGNFTGQVTMTFDSSGSTAPYIEVRVVGVAGTTALYVNNFLVGPGVLGQVPAVGPIESTTSYTIGATTTPPTPGTGATFYRRTTRDGDYAIIRWEFSQLAAGTAGSGLYSLPLPSGLTIDSSRITLAANARGYCGGGIMQIVTQFTNVVAYIASTNSVGFSYDNQGASGTTYSDVGSAAGGLNNTSVRWGIEVRLPIAEWAGSGTVNLGAGAQPTYASNSSVTTTTNTTDFQYGEGGALIQAFAPAGTASIVKRVRSPYPNPKFQVLQYFFNGNWTPVFWNRATNDAGTTFYGAFILPVTGSTTDYDVFFQSAPDPANTWSARAAGGDRWRVVFADTPAAVGFGLATATDSGLTPAYNTISGRYTPTTTSTTNIASTTPVSSIWFRVGNFITVAGDVGVATTAASNTKSEFSVSLPVPSPGLTGGDLYGSGSKDSSSGTSGMPVVIVGDGTNKRARLIFQSTQTAASDLTFTFTYEVK